MNSDVCSCWSGCGLQLREKWPKPHRSRAVLQEGRSDRGYSRSERGGKTSDECINLLCAVFVQQKIVTFRNLVCRFLVCCRTCLPSKSCAFTWRNATSAVSVSPPGVSSAGARSTTWWSPRYVNSAQPKIKEKEMELFGLKSYFSHVLPRYKVLNSANVLSFSLSVLSVLNFCVVCMCFSFHYCCFHETSCLSA